MNGPIPWPVSQSDANTVAGNSLTKAEGVRLLYLGF